MFGAARAREGANASLLLVSFVGLFCRSFVIEVKSWRCSGTRKSESVSFVGLFLCGEVSFHIHRFVFRYVSYLSHEKERVCLLAGLF